MKSIGEIMKELGFNANSSLDSQKAFIKHLVNQADLKSQKTLEIPETEKPKEPEQLCFQFGDDKKVS